MDKTIVKDGWLYRNGFLRKNCKIRLTDITQMKRKKNGGDCLAAIFSCRFLRAGVEPECAGGGRGAAVARGGGQCPGGRRVRGHDDGGGGFFRRAGQPAHPARDGRA